MTAESLTVAGRHFRTKADYEAALRDQKKINTIKAQTDLEDPVQLYELYGEMQSGIYRFETLVGNDFDDEIYERIEKLKGGPNKVQIAIDLDCIGLASVQKKEYEYSYWGGPIFDDKIENIKVGVTVFDKENYDHDDHDRFHDLMTI